MYADYNFYVERYHGSVDESVFPMLAEKASGYLDYYTMGKAKYNAELEPLKMACCALVDQYYEIDKLQAAYGESASKAASLGKKSESVGSYSVTYLSTEEFKGNMAALKAERAEIVKMYLAGTNLLYRGGCRNVCTSYRNGI